ncbi:hypothetical protein GGR88_001981 [Sphingomonas jejuensis]|uniref:Uncharacterized protein n=1 Tax=Sphingomonas jejuensis TaxID=904715 RepID=A0ABX0XM62_9SPHN|nr:hypothetical protein [Sphingomonas jejuensis]
MSRSLWERHSHAGTGLQEVDPKSSDLKAAADDYVRRVA